MNNKNIINNKIKSYNNFIHKLLAVISVSALISPFIYSMIQWTIKLNYIIVFFITFFVILSGYGLQSLYCALFKVKRVSDNNSYEKTTNFVDKKHIVFSIAVSIIIGFLSVPLVNQIFINQSKIRGNAYDIYNFVPYIVAISIIGLLVGGIVIWFYPYNRIISPRTIIPMSFLLVIDSIINVFYNQSYNLNTSLSAVIFFISSLILLNQGHLQKIYASAMNTDVPISAQLYNLVIIIVLLIIAAVIFGLFFPLILNFVVWIRIFIFSFFKLKNANNDVYEEIVISDNIKKEIFGGIISGFDEAGNIALIIFIISFIILAAVILFFIVIRYKRIWMLIKTTFNNIMTFILEFLNRIFLYKTEKIDSFEIKDYQDEEIKMDASSVIEYKKEAVLKKRNYKYFLSQLYLCKSLSEKLKYSYSVLIFCLREEKMAISVSDTPREINKKLIIQQFDEIIDDITKKFETIKYAEINSESNETEKLIDNICDIIKRYTE